MAEYGEGGGGGAGALDNSVDCGRVGARAHHQRVFSNGSSRIGSPRHSYSIASPQHRGQLGGHHQFHRNYVVEDPSHYRPATPILQWEGPPRSLKPPKIQLWMFITFVCSAQMIILAFVPSHVSNPDLFTAIWIAVSSLVTGCVVFMSTSRHLNSLGMLMQSINNPIDMDNVVERLERGRFSRFEEPWKVQVHIIKMFCRLLKYHHGVDPRNGLLLNGGRSVHVVEHEEFDDDFEASGANPVDQYTTHSSQAQNVSSLQVDDEVGAFHQLRRGAEISSAAATVARGNCADYSLSPETLQNVRGSLGERDDVDELELSLYSVSGSPVRPPPIDDGAPPPTRSASPPDRVVTLPQIESARDVVRPQLQQQALIDRKGSTAAVVRRRLRVSGDPLRDNAKSWNEVLDASGSSEVQSRSLLLQLLSQVSVGQDLSKVVLPVSILEPRSLLEKLSDLFVHPSLFGEIGEARDDVDCVQRIARWYVSGFHMRPHGAKKPYNPILGETFEAVFLRGTKDELWYLAEQVSHHPPISVFTARHMRSGVHITASYQPKSKLINPNCGASIGEGLLVLHTGRRTYHLTWPSAYVSGVLTGPMRLEVVGDVSITPVPKDSLHVAALLKFERKGYFTGSYDRMQGTISRGKERLYSIDGLWHEVMTIQRVWPNASQTAAEPKKVFFDPVTEQAERPFAVETVHSKPSRLVWKAVTIALRNKDAAAAKLAKDEVESAQREAWRAREARGSEYLPALFRMTENAAALSLPLREWTYVGPPIGGDDDIASSLHMLPRSVAL